MTFRPTEHESLPDDEKILTDKAYWYVMFGEFQGEDKGFYDLLRGAAEALRNNT